MNRLNAPTGFKSIGDSGSFSGYASIFGNIDLGGDIIERGAFKEFNTNKDGLTIILSQHRTADIIGLASVSQDDKGLAFQGQLILDVAKARESYSLMKAGALSGMSIGYNVLPGGSKILNSGVRQLTALSLMEVSPVTWGMNPQAGIDAVKSASDFDQIRDYEDYLREAGFSRSEAKKKASEGFKAKGLRDVGQVLQLRDFVRGLDVTPRRDVGKAAKELASQIRKISVI